MGFQFEQHRLGLWDLSWDLKKTISREMGLGPPFTTLWMDSNNSSSKSEFDSSTTCILFWLDLPRGFPLSGGGRCGGLFFLSCVCLLLHTCSQWFHWLHFLYLVSWAGHFFFPWLSPHFPHWGFWLIASMLVSRLRADAPCCPRDFMSLTVASLFLAMSSAFLSFSLSSFPKRASCTLGSLVPIISCSIRRSSISASLNRHLCWP